MAVQLSNDWSFLNMFLHSIRKWSDADALMQKSGQRQSSALRISVLALGIDEEIKACDYGRVFFMRPHKLLNFLGDCRRKTDEFLKEDVVGVVEYILCLKFQEEHDHIRARKGDMEALQWDNYKSMPFTQCISTLCIS